jgi:hypothetical protein
MADMSRWVPLRWPWPDASLLSILDGTPVNCLVVDWAAGQRQALAPLVEKCKAAGHALVGMVSGGDRAAAFQSARAAGLDAVIAEGDAPDAPLPVLPLSERAKTPWNSPSPILAVNDNVWPATALAPARGDALTGPTNSPWIDSNAWFLRLARVRARAKTCWLLFDPPGPPDIVPAETYLRAVADAAAFGGRWVVSLDEKLRAGLAAGDTGATGTWKTLANALAFFEKHRGWTALEPQGVVGVVSDFAGANEMVGTELLNLIGRRNLPFRIVDKSVAEGASLAGFKALVAVDEELPPPALRRRLLDFAEQGGVLLVSQSWQGERGTPTGQPHPRIDIRRLGKGKLAVAKGDAPDPFMVARDIHVLLGRAEDLTRYFNIEAFISSYAASPDGTPNHTPEGAPDHAASSDGTPEHAASPDGAHALFQVTSFSRRLQDDRVSVWFRRPYRAAQLWTIGSEAPSPAAVTSENGGITVQVPGMKTYAAIELSG